jgi:hypothetical protein
MRITDTMHHLRFRLMTSVSVMTLVLSMTLVATAAAQNARGRASPATFQYRDLTKELANTMTGTFTVAAVGDLLIQEPIGKRMSVARTPAPELALDILTKVQKFSEPFGTKISIENGVGVIRVPPEATVPVGACIREEFGRN